MDIFVIGFWILIVICVALFLLTRTAQRSSSDVAFRAFQRTYMVVYLLAMGGSPLAVIVSFTP